MEALREVVKLNNNQLDLSLQVNFDTKYVEVIILPFYENYADKQKIKTRKELTDFQKFLLSAPIMTNEDYNYFLEKKTKL